MINLTMVIILRVGSIMPDHIIIIKKFLMIKKLHNCKILIKVTSVKT